MKVVLITIDAWRVSHASFLSEGTGEYTPNLDSFASDAVSFPQAISHGPATPYAFPALFSAALPLDCGGYERMSPDRTLVSEALSGAGWRCFGIHANPWLGAPNGYNRGYDVYRDVGEFGLPFFDRARRALLDRFSLDHPVYRSAQSVYRYAQTPLRALASNGEDEVSLARKAVRAGTDRSFTWVHLLDPHAPYTPPQRHREAVGVPDTGTDPAALVTRAQRAPGSLDERERAVIRGLYGASVRHADERVGAVLDAVPEDALVVVTADHGEALFEHGQVGHEPALFDELIRVPLLVRPPDRSTQTPAAIDAQVRHIDVAPTVLDYAGVDRPGSFAGRSLRPAIEGMGIDDRLAISEVASSANEPGRIDPEALQVSARLPNRKLVYRTGRYEGYDLEADPGEEQPIGDPVGAEWNDLREAISDRCDRISFDGPVAIERDGSTQQRLRALGYVD